MLEPSGVAFPLFLDFLGCLLFVEAGVSFSEMASSAALASVVGFLARLRSFFELVTV